MGSENFHLWCLLLCILIAFSHGLPLKQSKNAEKSPTKDDGKSGDKDSCCKCRRTIIAPTKESDKPSAKETSCRCLCAKSSTTPPKTSGKEEKAGQCCSCGKPEKRECHHWECHKECPDGTLSLFTC